MHNTAERLPPGEYHELCEGRENNVQHGYANRPNILRHRLAPTGVETDYGSSQQNGPHAKQVFCLPTHSGRVQGHPNSTREVENFFIHLDSSVARAAERLKTWKSRGDQTSTH